MLLVLDTSVLVAAVRSKAGLARRVLDGCLFGDFTPALSVPLFFEYEAVLTRDRHLRAAGATREDIDALLDLIAARSDLFAPGFRWRPQLPDPADEFLLDLAVAASAPIVTYNVRHFGAASDFGVKVVTPRQFLEQTKP